MPWSTPTLRDVRSAVRDAITGQLPGADANVPNSVLRVLSDAMGALCHLVLQYVDWLALQLLPDTAETEWLDRHGHIWLTNADGSTGRKLATLASGEATFTATASPLSVVVPTGTQLIYAGTNVTYATTADIQVAALGAPSAGPIQALDPGSAGNLDPGTTLGLVTPVPGVDGSATVVQLDGGTDDETDDELRARILQRIQQPPMGGDDQDFVRWALSVPGVTRAWCYPLEMGIGTVTVRFMMDDLRAYNDGFPLPVDVANVQAYIDTVRPVAVKDCFVEAPLPFPVDMTIFSLSEDTTSMRTAIEGALEQMLFEKAIPGATIYRSWVEEAIMSVIGNATYELNFTTLVMPAPGYLGVLGTIQYAG